MANVRNTVTDTYQGETIQCAEFVTDNILEFFRVCPLNESGDYAFQMVAKSTVNGNRVVIFLHDAYHLFTLTTEWQFYSYVFKDVVIEDGDHMEIMFKDAGTFRIYHSKLEKGNKVTDWNEADYDGRANTDAIKENIYYPGTVYINGGKLMAETVTADKLLVNNLTAITANIAGFKFSQDGKNIVYEDASEDQMNNPAIELYKDPDDPTNYGHAKYGYPYAELLKRGVRTVSHTDPVTHEVTYTYEPYENTSHVGGNYITAFYDAYPEENSLDDITDESYNPSNYTLENSVRFYADADGGTIQSLTSDFPGRYDHAPLDLRCDKATINQHEIWHENNLVCGHKESSSISSHTGGNATITIPTDEIGSNPVINLTKYNYSDDVWLNSINTSGANTVINVGVYNGGSSARTVKFDYMIAKHS